MSNLFLTRTHANHATARDPARARALVLAHGWNATAYQILNPGSLHWFAASWRIGACSSPRAVRT